MPPIYLFFPMPPKIVQISSIFSTAVYFSGRKVIYLPISDADAVPYPLLFTLLVAFSALSFSNMRNNTQYMTYVLDQWIGKWCLWICSSPPKQLLKCYLLCWWLLSTKAAFWWSYLSELLDLISIYNSYLKIHHIYVKFGVFSSAHHLIVTYIEFHLPLQQQFKCAS